VTRRPFQTGIFVLVIFALVVSAFFMANVEMPRWSYVVSSISVVLFAVPSIWAAKMWLGRRDGITLFALLGVAAVLIEISAITTGFPYGHFGYSEHLGYKLFAVVPWTVAFAWPPLLLAAYALAANATRSRLTRIVITTLALLIFDVVLDPGAVMLGFWKYADTGSFYGVPLSNFLGWLVSGFLGAVILEIILARLRPLLPVPIQLSASAFFIICFWTAFAAFAGMIAPALIGVAVLVALIAAWRRFHYDFDDKIVFVDEDNTPIGTASKLESHNDDTRLHRAFSVFIFNRRGELLLQQRALSKKTWPGVWSNSCCGHVMLHESVVRAAARRLKYELGLGGIELGIALPNFRYRAEKDGIVENEICPVLIGVTDTEPVPNPTEVANVKWIGWSEFLTSLDDPGTDISPWAKQEVHLLTESETFRKWFAHEVRASSASASVC
jgi:isopentenyl-diphosphate delta-isomerase